jgi:hypothetical protein
MTEHSQAIRHPYTVPHILIPFLKVLVVHYLIMAENIKNLINKIKGRIFLYISSRFMIRTVGPMKSNLSSKLCFERGSQKIV